MGSVQLGDNQAVSNNSQLEVSDALLLKGGNQSNTSGDRLMTFIESIISKKEDEKEPFYVLDLEMVSSLVKKWNGSLPNVKPYYAVKCNHNPALLVELARLGAGFDCASRAEIQAAMALGIPSNTIIYANPCKAESHIKYAASVGVNLTTFDSLEELQKIQKWHSNCTLLLRIKTGDDGDARCPLGPKYGALPEEIPLLLQAAKTAQLNVAGVSFHVGSGVRQLQAYYSAIESAKAVFHTAAQLGMPKLHILNIGGGFSVGQKFDEAAITIRAALESYFPYNPSSLSVIAEPGRFFAETCFTLVTTIIGKRVRGDLREYWVNDGLYGSMNCILYDHATVIAMPLACSSSPVNPACQGSKKFSSTVFGPTCDALDTILTGCQLPELQVNDWLLFPNMGAYTACAGSKFNGFDTSAIPTYILANSNVT